MESGTLLRCRHAHIQGSWTCAASSSPSTCRQGGRLTDDRLSDVGTARSQRQSPSQARDTRAANDQTSHAEYTPNARTYHQVRSSRGQEKQPMNLFCLRSPDTDHPSCPDPCSTLPLRADRPCQLTASDLVPAGAERLRCHSLRECKGDKKTRGLNSHRLVWL